MAQQIPSHLAFCTPVQNQKAKHGTNPETLKRIRGSEGDKSRKSSNISKKSVAKSAENSVSFCNPIDTLFFCFFIEQ